MNFDQYLIFSKIEFQTETHVVSRSIDVSGWMDKIK